MVIGANGDVVVHCGNHGGDHLGPESEANAALIVALENRDQGSAKLGRVGPATKEFKDKLLSLNAPLPWASGIDGSLHDHNGNFVAQVGVGPEREDPAPGEIAAYIMTAVNTCGGFRASLVDKDERVCRVCGCTEYNACVDDNGENPCHWVEDDLCSACVPIADEMATEAGEL